MYYMGKLSKFAKNSLALTHKEKSQKADLRTQTSPNPNQDPLFALSQNLSWKCFTAFTKIKKSYNCDKYAPRANLGAILAIMCQYWC